MTDLASGMLPQSIASGGASVNKESPTAPLARAKLLSMSQTRTERVGNSAPDKATTIARRLRRLLDYLQLEPAEFASRTKLAPSYVSRLLSGDRGKSGEASKLELAVQRAFGIGGHFWTSRVDLDPAQCKMGGSTAATPPEGDEMGTLVGRQEFGSGADARAELALMAARKGDPSDLIRDIMLVEAPPNATAAWWVRTYFDLASRHTPSK